MLAGPRPPLPEFQGAEHETPRRFLQQCEEYFTAVQTAPQQRTAVAEKGLRGDAEKWWSTYKEMDFAWDQFRDFLLNQYDSRAVHNSLLAQLYSKKQAEREPSGTFVQRKHRLFQRLRPEDSELSKVEAILGLMKTTLRRAFRPRNPQNLADLLRMSVEAERDEEEDRAAHPRAKATEDKLTTSQAKKVDSKAARLPPKCWYCPETHFHRDCPVLKQRQDAQQGNWRQTTPTPQRRQTAVPTTTPAPPALPIERPSLNTLASPTQPRVKVFIGGSEFSALLDSAAAENFVHPGSLPLNTFIKEAPTIVDLAAENASMTCQGTATFNVGIKDKQFKVTAIVAPALRHSLILGFSWMQREKATLDLGRNLFKLGLEQRITVHLVNQPQPTPPPAIDRSLVRHGYSGDYEAQLYAIIQENAALFAAEGKRLKQTEYTQHVIKLKDERPFRIHPYRYADRKRAIIEEQTREMLIGDIIEPCDSAWNSPVVIVTRKDGTPRFCIDFRRLNEITEDSSQPIPVIHDAIRELGQAKIFSTLDLKNGYWQIKLSPESKQYTAFSTPSGGTYQFKVMPFGLKGAPGTFQRFISQEVLGDLLGVCCVVYLDDVIIYSDSPEQHLYHTQLVFERLVEHGHTVNLTKSLFGKLVVDYLGHVISVQGNDANPVKIEEISKAAVPRNKKELRGFIGACSWLRDYVPHLSIKLAPLTDLCSNKRSFRWTEEAQKAFEDTKMAFQQPFALSRPDRSRTMILQTDASQLGLGAVLFHENEDKSRDIISFASRKLHDAETRYHINHQECLALVWAITKFRPYLEDRPFILRTDSQALTHLNAFKHTNNKLWRWSMLLQEFSFILEHCPGSRNELPDLLSRHPLSNEEVFDIDDGDALVPPTQHAVPSQAANPMLCNIEERDFYDELRGSLQTDPGCAVVVQKILHLRSQLDLTEADHQFLQLHAISDRFLWTRRQPQDPWKIPVPEGMRQRVTYEYHDGKFAGHPGADETIRAIQERFHWPGLARDVRSYVQACYLCACTKRTNAPSSTALHPRRPSQPWDTIAVDLMGPYPRSAKGNQFIYAVTDLFSRWVEAFPLKSSDAKRLTTLMEQEIFPRWGYPRSILSDNGPQFVSREWATSCDSWQVHHWTTPIYHPRANPTERRNQEIKKGLRLHLHDEPHKHWDHHLADILYTLRNRRNAATGQTPAQLLLGRSLARPGEWQAPQPDATIPNSEARIAAAAAQQDHYVETYAREDARPTTYLPGAQVYSKTHTLSNAAAGISAGLSARWAGPYTVTAVLTGGVYTIQRDNEEVKVHASQLKPCIEGPTIAAPPVVPLPAIIEEDDDLPAPRYNLRDRKAIKMPYIHKC